jgi:hypothetical protein
MNALLESCVAHISQHLHFLAAARRVQTLFPDHTMSRSNVWLAFCNQNALGLSHGHNLTFAVVWDRLA